VYGVVDEISMRATRVMTFDGVALIVPNSKFISDVRLGASAQDHRGVRRGKGRNSISAARRAPVPALIATPARRRFGIAQEP
jgi:hypothetical protein